MTWFKPFETADFFLIGIFSILYLAYLWRVIRIGRALQTDYRSVFIKVLLRTAFFGLLIVALLGPSFGETSKEVRSIGKDIYICLDLSQSMNAFDIQPTRLEKLKFELKNIVEAFNSDLIGLIIFSSEAFVQCPLTFDQSALFLFIDGLNSGLVPNAGTDFGPPLRMALNKLNSDEAATDQQKSKIIILISDGEDFGENSTAVAEEIENSEIKLFTLGIGTGQGSKIVTQDGFKKDKEGKDVVSRLNSKALKALAIRTGGKYFEINENRNDVARLVNSISSIEGELRDTKRMDVSDNKYHYFLTIALLLIAMDILVNIKTITV